jgi:hypothetical protein
MLQVAVLGLPGTRVALAQPNPLPFSLKMMVPLGALPLTLAVSTTVSPTCAGLAELVSTVAVTTGGKLPDAYRAMVASTIPEPQIAVVQSLLVPVGNCATIATSTYLRRRQRRIDRQHQGNDAATRRRHARAALGAVREAVGIRRVGPVLVVDQIEPVKAPPGADSTSGPKLL